jgi:16S rRNA C967 or C1407 C5-methylase (RsmB/RsmF family)
MLPDGFVNMMRGLLGGETDAFLEAMQLPPVTSVRLNRRKPGAEFPGSRPVAWCPDGLYLPQRPLFTLDPLLHAGAYYVQDASSMIHQEATARIISRLKGDAGDAFPVTLLDLCAAPGGKTTAMINALPDGSRVVANEYVARRATILRENLTKWGYPHVQVTNRDSSWFARSGDKFDIVAVDAPCSGEGMMRKDEDAVKQWSPQLIEECARLQREILTNAVEALAPGGYLIYSTCTFNTIENESIAEFIYNSLKLIDIDLDFPAEWGIPRGIGTTLPVYRFMPHRTEGEGLFLAVFQKPGEIDADSRRHVGTPSLVVKRPLKGKMQPQPDVPPIEEILSVDFDRTRFPMVELTEQQAVSYLRRESVVLPPDTPKGICILTYRGLPLGPAKNIGQRANNLYPKGWRILMR